MHEALIDKENIFNKYKVKTFFAFTSLILIAFQTFINFNNKNIQVNLCDPLALISFLILIMKIFLKKELPSWKVKSFNTFIALFVFLLSLSLFKGFLIIGYTSWAFINKFFGLLIILGYLNLGYMIKKNLKFFDLMVFMKWIIFISSSVVFFHLIIRIDVISQLLPSDFISFNFQGFQANRNSFSFQLLCSLTVLMGLYKEFSKFNKNKDLLNFNKDYILFSLGGLILVGIYVSGSKTAYVTLIVINLFSLLLKFIDIKFLLKLVIFSSIIYFTFYYLELFLNSLSSSSVIKTNTFENYNNFEIINSSTTIRLNTISVGLELFKKNILLGSGLGYFRYISPDFFDGKYITIHSTPIWILAEFGLITFLVFVNELKNILVFCFKNLKTFIFSRLIVILLLNFIVFSLAHEILYQRIFWMILGLTLASDGLFNSVLNEKNNKIEPA